MSLSLIIFMSIFFLLIKNDKNYNQTYGVFLSDINITKLFISNKDTTSKQDGEKKIVEEVNKDKTFQLITILRHSGYNRIYNTSIMMW